MATLIRYDIIDVVTNPFYLNGLWKIVVGYLDQDNIECVTTLSFASLYEAKNKMRPGATFVR